MRKIKDQRSLGKRPPNLQDVDGVIIQAPVGGWNAIDPLARMDPKFAPILQNWVPRTGWVELRPGYQPWVQNPNVTVSPVETLMTYRPAASAEVMFAATGSTIWNVSGQGLPLLALSGKSSARWQYLNFTPAGGANYLYAVNGVDAPILFNGSAWSNPSLTGGPSASTLINIAIHKRRIWFVQANSTSAWFLATDAISGALTQLDIGALLTKGGYLMATGTITVDGGNGPDDLTCFLSSRGEVVIYKGTDPTNANAWAMVGVFTTSPPIGRRCLLDLGSDLGVITLQGLIPLSQAFPLDTDAIRSIALTRNIQNAVLQSAAMFQDNFGWQLCHFPAQGLVFMNVPTATNSAQQQYVQNMLNGSWFSLAGWNANCFEIFNDELYFGDNLGNVNQAWVGGADNISAIIADGQCAFNYLGDPNRIKRMTMARPLIVSSGQVTLSLGVDVDFGSTDTVSPTTAISPSGGIYDVSVYDSAVYGGNLSTIAQWQGVSANEGIAFAMRFQISSLPAGAGSSSLFDIGVFDSMIFDGVGIAGNTLQLHGFNTMHEKGAYV